MDLNGSQLKVELARLDERLKALVDELERTEIANKEAIHFAAIEVGRRIEHLNGAHAETARVQGTYLPRETYERDRKEEEGRVLVLEKLAERMWLPMIVIGMVAAGAGAAIVKLLFP